MNSADEHDHILNAVRGSLSSRDQADFDRALAADPALRARFDEAKWNRWNLMRAVLTTAAFACLIWALVQHGQNT